jgi:probable O-glycosylation ligase (exosortase A-associated)
MLFHLTTLHLLLEFGRPQELLPVLAPLRLPGIVSGLLVLALCLSKGLSFSAKPTRLFVLFLAFMALHVPLALNNYVAFEFLRYLLITFVAYLALATSVDTFGKFHKFVILWLSVHVFLAINGIATGGRGVGGFLGDENDFAMTINMIVPFSFFLARSQQDVVKKALYLAVTALFVLANMYSFSRGGFVGLLAVAICCWLRSPYKLRSLSVIAVLALLVSVYAREGYWQRLESGWEQGLSAGTGEDRAHMWKFAWKMFLDNPIAGVGQGNFPVRFGEYEGYELLHGHTRVWRAAHSLYFTLLPELGLVGTLLFAAMLHSIWRDIAAIRRLTLQRFDARTRPQPILAFADAIEASLVGFLVSSVFISTLYYPNFWVMMGFVVALRRIVTAAASRPGVEAVASTAAGRPGRL